MLPRYILYPRRTVMPPGVDWPAVRGYTPARGPRLPDELQIPHQSVHEPQDPLVEDFSRLSHVVARILRNPLSVVVSHCVACVSPTTPILLHSELVL